MNGLALRNIGRNRRRSLTTIAAIALGFSAIALFAGYTHNVYRGLEQQAIRGELLGHLTVMKRGMETEGKLDPERFSFTAKEVTDIEKLLRQEPHLKLVAPRLALSGLASNGRASTIFIADGISPQAMEELQHLNPEEAKNETYERMFKKLDPVHPEVAELSSGLARLLHLKPGANAALLVETYSGEANAADIRVGKEFDTGSSASNDKFAFLSLALAQRLLDAEGRADRITLLLDDEKLTDFMRERIEQKLRAAGFDVEVKSWRDLSDFYRQVHSMFDMIFGFIFSIVLTVVVMSVANSMGMTVIERTREIGTLRALGLQGSGVVCLFSLESMLLTLMGSGSGLLLTLLVRHLVNGAHISYTPPDAAEAVPLLVDFDWKKTGFAFLLMLFVGTLAAWLPARRASRQPITEALGHV